MIRAIKYFLLLIGLTSNTLNVFSQTKDILKLVNPFIGTTKSQNPTFWGGDGGTYPGATAPFGSIQLTPETSNTEPKGYNYPDNSILYFTCTNHWSGYPSGSSGKIRIMPLQEKEITEPDSFQRPFLHSDELAEPGYYRVMFSDDHSIAEASASERTGMFRFTFPEGVKPRIFLGDMGKMNSKSNHQIEGEYQNVIFVFQKDFVRKEEIEGALILTFSENQEGKNEILVKISVSTVDFASTQKNIRKEAENWDFESYKYRNQQKWASELSVIEVEDNAVQNKKIFYTALYHSMLMPNIISDVDGNYTGSDRLVHQTKGKNEYKGFSAWDTFRSLHPLLCLIAPELQNDMILSMLDYYVQAGKLPGDPMTGNHTIAIIADSYLKGIRGFDKALAFEAMNATLLKESVRPDFASYISDGYVSSNYSESVTKTLEYAYDDWAMAQFSKYAMNDETACKNFLKRSFNYQNLFDSQSLFFLPRNKSGFIAEPENFGYKEGDKWSYSLFIPHNPRDLINLSGGNDQFSAHLDSALRNQNILFDNEPVLHVPYLFNYAGHPELTQQWVKQIRSTLYSNTPGGLPGNDDLGSMSSWYVFSAMGFFPVCPGRPVYDLGTPLFKKVTINLQNGKKLTVNSENNTAQNCFVHSITLNKKKYRKLWITHSDLVEGGELKFKMDAVPDAIYSFGSSAAAPSETTQASDIRISDFTSKTKNVEPNESFWLNFSLLNKGSLGTKVITLFDNGLVVGRKNIKIESKGNRSDSIECRLYPVGNHTICLNNKKFVEIEVSKPKTGLKPVFEINGLQSNMIVRSGATLNYSYLIKNLSGYTDNLKVNSFVNDSLVKTDQISIDPGKTMKIRNQLKTKQVGIFKLHVQDKCISYKVYHSSSDASIIDLSATNDDVKDTVYDCSGLANHGVVTGTKELHSEPIQKIKCDENCFVEFKPAASLNQLGEKITIMAWIFPDENNHKLSDIITKGDFIALQTFGNKELSFFSGGWGRGSCTVSLPENWIGNWHHIAGVCDGQYLNIYLDGKKSGSQFVGNPVSLNSTAKWMIGRNQEFPDKRYFTGYVQHLKISVEALNSDEIQEAFEKSLPDREN